METSGNNPPPFFFSLKGRAACFGRMALRPPLLGGRENGVVAPRMGEKGGISGGVPRRLSGMVHRRALSLRFPFEAVVRRF